MNITHELAIRILLTALKEKGQTERRALFDSLKLLIEDLKAFFDESVTNAPYMKEKASLFIGACQSIADPELLEDFENNATYAESNYSTLKAMSQCK